MSFPLLSRRAALLTPSWARNELWRRARAVPSLDLRFAESKSLIDAVSGQQLITFSRVGSGGTFVNSAGQIETAAENVPRFDHNPVTLESLGLLVEEQRTQLLELTDTLATQTKTVAAVAHTLSFYGTGTVALSGVHTATVVGTGAYPARTTLTFTPTAGSLTLTVTGTVQFGQLEAGAFATSYIPNAGTGQVTRSADVVSITGANFSSWYRQGEGTMFAGFIPQAAPFSAGRPVWGLSDGISSRIDFRCRPTSKGGLLVLNAGASQADTSGTNNYTTGKNTSAIAYAANNFASCLNSESPATDSLGTVPTSINQLLISAAGNISGVISRLTYWPQRLPNPTLQNITL